MPVNNDPMISSTTPVQPAPQPTQQPKTPGKLGRIFGTILGGAANIVAPGAGSLIGGFINGGGGVDSTNMQSILNQQAENSMRLLSMQTEMQNQTQNFTAVSNLLKARHDGEMSAVHNFKS